ncbi:hypothetical protein AVEN_104706-1, partial [Araneus ventricosus]
MTRTTPELAPLSRSFHSTPPFGPLCMGYQAAGPIHGGSSVESGFEPGTLRLQSRDLTTRPPPPRG